MNKRILVTEDDPARLSLTVYILQHEGYQVLTTANGLEGLRKGLMEKPDLIILDVMLPGMDGFEICRRLRTDSKTAQLPILMLSANGREIDKATALTVGANDYMSQPWHRLEFVTKIATMLEQKSAVLSSNCRGGRSYG